MTRVLFIAVFAATLARVASASYELAMYGAGNLGYVQRIDPVTGANLGKFGTGYLGDAKGIALDGNTGDVYVADYASARILKFNYSTGEFKSSFYVGADTIAYRVTRLSDGTLLVGSEGSNLVRYSASGNKIDTYTFPGLIGSIVGQAQTSSGFVWACTSGKQLYRISIGSTAATLTGLALPASNFPIGLSADGNDLAYGNYSDDCYQQVLSTTAGGLASLKNSESVGAGEADALLVRATGFGHGGMVYSIIQDATTSSNYMYRWDPKSYYYSRFAIPGNGFTGTQMAIVVAPEPQTIVAMLAGCGLMLRRRRGLAAKS